MSKCPKCRILEAQLTIEMGTLKRSVTQLHHATKAMRKVDKYTSDLERIKGQIAQTKRYLTEHQLICDWRADVEV